MRPKRRHHSRPATRSNLVLRKNRVDINSLDFGIRKRHLTYICRLINSYYLTDDLIEASLSYIDHRDLHLFIDEIYGVSANINYEDDREDNYINCICYLNNSHHLQ